MFGLDLCSILYNVIYNICNMLRDYFHSKKKPHRQAKGVF